jgi:DNA polymerase (family 10)
VGDLDVLVLADDSVPVMDRFVDYEDVADVLAEGDTRASVVFRSGLQVDVRVVPSNSYGAALLYFTGSKAHNVALRNRALDRDLKINEYGIFETNGEETQVGGATEDEMYDALGLPYIAPELREQRGEIDAAEAGTLPPLIEADDLRGNLHTHTTDSDGAASIQEMADAAAERGFEYLAITDHSPHVGIVNGLDADALRHQIDRIHALNDERDDLTLLAGIEVDILKDGALDLPDDVLAALDVCIAAVHTNLGLSEEVQTERILRALDNPHVHMLAHPTGRRMGQRAPYDLDVPRLIEGAAERGVILELNAQPDRLDLNDTYCKAAKEAGVMIAIGADAHRPDSLDLLHYGVAQARRGWLTAEDVLNTRTWPEVKALIDR